MTTLPPVPAFATVHDLETNLGAEKEAVALERATDLIRGELGQDLAPPVLNDSVTVYGHGRRFVQLPQLPVTRVASVSARNVAFTVNQHYRVDLAAGTLERMWWGWPRSEPLVIVYDHGYARLPNELVRLCAAVADKILAGTIEVRQLTETFGSHNESITYARASDTVFSESELKVLSKYRPQVLP